MIRAGVVTVLADDRRAGFWHRFKRVAEQRIPQWDREM
jgi:hypothetical protein